METTNGATNPTTNRFPFTPPKLRAWPTPASGRISVWDTKTPGLSCAISSAGGRVYYHVKKSKVPDATGKRPVIRTRLGTVDEIGIDDARARAEELNGTFAKRINPTEQRRADERAKQSEKEFSQTFAAYIADRRAKGKRTVDEMERKGEIYFREFNGRKVNDITFEEVRDLHKRIADGITFEGETYGGKGAANRAIELLSAVFNFARRHADNPCRGIEANPIEARERFLQPSELPAFFEALKPEPATLRDFFKMALWTGQRRANVQAMRWDEINEAGGTWTIPAAKFKTGKELTIPLAPQAVAILAERRAANAKRKPPHEYVFPSHRGMGRGKAPHLTEPKAAWARILKRGKLSNLRIHDLRHTLASWQVAGGTSLAIIGKSLGHRQVQTTARYAHVQLDPVRQSINAATAAIEAASKPAEGEGQPKVAPKKKRTKRAK